MRRMLVSMLLLTGPVIAETAWGHGIGLEYDGTSILVVPGSESPLYTGANNSPVPPNMFVDVWVRTDQRKRIDR